MAAYAEDPAKADLLLQVACTRAANPLPLYRILYKFYNRQRRFDMAQDYAHRALAEAARQGGLALRFGDWRREDFGTVDPTMASQALLALKALAFIALRAGDEASADPFLTKLAELDPEDGSGASVVAALAAGM